MLFSKMKGALRILFKSPLYFFLSILAIPAVLMIRIIRPWLLVRWGSLISSRIGHFAANTELYLCEHDAGINVPRQCHMDLFYMGFKPICNQQLTIMWKRILRIWPSWILTPISLVNRFIPGGMVHEIGSNTQHDRDVHNLFDQFPPHLSFTTDEEQFGKTGLKDLGIPDGTPFVCLHVRDSAYLDNAMPGVSWRYHDYLDTSVENYILAAEELVDRDYIVLRMGAVVKESLKIESPKIIDYATKYRSDFMDIYLESKCSFHLGSPSGLNAIPLVFRRPRATVNFSALEYIYSWKLNELIIPKKLWLKEDSRFITLREVLESGAGEFLHTEQYIQYGIELIENTPEEIKALAIEMDERLKGTWQTTAEDEDLQRRFWEIFKKYANPNLHGEYRARIGAHFLRNNLYWLQ